VPESPSASTRAVRLSRAPAGIGPAYRAWVLSSLRTIARACGVQVQIDGASSAQSHGDRVSFKVATGGGEFEGLWYPKRGSSDTQLIITGGSIFDGTTLHTVAGATLSVHATSLNYIYLDCGLTATTVDGYVSGGTVDATPTIATSTSAASLTNSNSAGHILLCTWQEGALVDRYAYFTLACELLQKRSGSVGDVTFNYWSY
jgi:hypothetical protein